MVVFSKSPFMAPAIGSGILLTVYLATMHWNGDFPRDLNDYALGRDFLNAWTYGQEAWSGTAGRFYDLPAYNQHLRELTGWDYQPQRWSYPPDLMLILAPFGRLPYLVAYAAWTGIGLLCLWRTTPKGVVRWRAFLALVLSPAGAICLVSGQSSFLTVALIAGVFACLDRRPALAGLLIGLLTIKPQIGFLFPVLLAASGRWRVFLWASLTAAGLAGATALIWGVDIWSLYLSQGAAAQEMVIHNPSLGTLALMPTAFMNARLLGLAAGPAYLVQGAFALFAVTAVFWTYRRQRNPLLSRALFVAASLTGTPYLMSYDLLPAVWCVLQLTGAGMLGDRDRLGVLAVLCLPLIAIAAAAVSIPLSAMIMPAVMIVLLRRLNRTERVLPPPRRANPVACWTSSTTSWTPPSPPSTGRP